METRKLIAFGKSSHVISLPNSWLKEHKLKKGDTIYLGDNGHDLSIMPMENGSEKEQKEIVIQTMGKELNLLETEIVSAYLNGYNLITIKGEELRKNASEIKRIIHNLSGLEIIEGTADRIVVKDLLDEEEVSIKKLIRRLDNIIRSMINDSIECLRTDLSESVYERDTDVNRLVFLTYRVMREAFENTKVARRVGLSLIELLFDWIIVTHLEKIGDQSKRIARFIVATNLKKEETEKLEAIYQDMKGKYEEVMKAYYTNDTELAYAIEVDDKRRIERCNKFMEKEFGKMADKDSCVQVSKVIEHLKGMSTSIENIARAVIGVEKPTNPKGE